MSWNVSDIINFDAIQIFKIYSYFVFTASVACQIFYAFLVLHCSTKQMLTFRILMLTYIFITFLAEFLFFLLKPIKLFTFNIMYPVGVLAPVSSITSGLGTGVILFLYYPLIDVLIVPVAERHFQITSVYGTHKTLHRVIIYGGLLATQVLTLTAIVVFVSRSAEDDKAQAIIRASVENAEILFTLQPSLFIVQVSSKFEFLLPLSILLGSGFYRFLFSLWLLFKNYTYTKSTILAFSKQTKRQFSLMLQTAVAQATITISVGSMGIVWMVLILIPGPNLSALSMVLAGIILLYPIIDVTATILIVRPYREFVLNQLRTRFAIKLDSISASKNANNSALFQKRTTIHSKSSANFGISIS